MRPQEFPSSASRIRPRFVALVLALLLPPHAGSAPPATIPFQGRISVDGIPFTGQGQFRFALVDGAGTAAWSSAPDADPADAVPDTAVALPVTKGLYAVSLGDGMSALPPDLFATHDDLRLRVWFDDGSHGVRQLTPDQPLGAVPFARRSAIADVAGTATSASSLVGKLPATQIDGSLAITQLPATVARLDSSPAFTGTVRASGFDGPGALPWQRVTATEVTARPNTGYLYDGEDSLTLTLPRDARVGDVVRLAAAGGVGWFATPEPGARLLGAAPGKYWTSSGPAGAWRGLAMSADGLRLVAVASNAPIALSTDGGHAWSSRDSARRWTAVASSADGTRLAATERGGRIWISRDAGVTWVPRGELGAWQAIASSSDGFRLVATQNPGGVTVSTDGGESWSPLVNSDGWRWVAGSADGQILAITRGSLELLRSRDGGLSWETDQAIAPTARGTASLQPGPVALSADGAQWFIADDVGTPEWDYFGALHIWDGVRRNLASVSPGTGNRQWSAVASSADGSRLFAAETDGVLWYSRDRGNTWTRSSAPAPWTAVACSADGMLLAAASEGGEIVTSEGWLEGPVGSTVEFVYAGDGRWQTATQPVLGPDQRLSPATVPDLPAAIVTSGTFSLDRLPDLPAAKITTGILAADRIPALPAGKITSGSLDVDRIPDLPAYKITSGVLDSALLPGYVDGRRQFAGPVMIGATAASDTPLNLASVAANANFGYCLSLEGRSGPAWKFGVDHDRRFSLGAAGQRDYDLSIDFSSGRVGIGDRPSDLHRLYVAGGGYFDGPVLSLGVLLFSDERLKTRMASLDNCLDHVCALRGVSYEWRTNAHAAPGLDGRQFGLVAQEVATVLPELVREGQDGYLAVNYAGLTPVLVEAVKELRHAFDRRLAEKDAELRTLRERLERLESVLGASANR